MYIPINLDTIINSLSPTLIGLNRFYFFFYQLRSYWRQYKYFTYLSVIYITDRYSWRTLGIFANHTSRFFGLQICESSCIRDVIPVFVENNFDCNVHVWSPAPYSFTRLFHLSILWNRSNKYKTLLHNLSFAASRIYILKSL